MTDPATATDDRQANLGTLPEWDLSDLYPDPRSDRLEADLARTEQEAKAFRQAYENGLADCADDRLAEAIRAYEGLQELLGRIMSYAQLVYAGDVSDPEIGRFYQTMQERTTTISTELLFFSLALNRLEDAALEARLAQSEALAHYRPWLRDLRAFRAHQLDDELERLLHEKYVAGPAAWTRLFDETMAALRFPLDGKDLTSAEVLHKLTDRDGAVRKAAAQSIGKVLGDNLRVFALIFNTLATDKAIEDDWRRYPRPVRLWRSTPISWCAKTCSNCSGFPRWRKRNGSGS